MAEIHELLPDIPANYLLAENTSYMHHIVQFKVNIHVGGNISSQFRENLQHAVIHLRLNGFTVY